jgi:hypothetical protein
MVFHIPFSHPHLTSPIKGEGFLGLSDSLLAPLL